MLMKTENNSAGFGLPLVLLIAVVDIPVVDVGSKVDDDDCRRGFEVAAVVVEMPEELG
jgi:hypothetical protein